MSLNAFTYHYQKWGNRKKYNFSMSKAKETYGAAKELVPVLSKDDLTKLIIKNSLIPEPTNLSGFITDERKNT